MWEKKRRQRRRRWRLRRQQQQRRRRRWRYTLSGSNSFAKFFFGRWERTGSWAITALINTSYKWYGSFSRLAYILIIETVCVVFAFSFRKTGSRFNYALFASSLSFSLVRLRPHHTETTEQKTKIEDIWCIERARCDNVTPFCFSWILKTKQKHKKSFNSVIWLHSFDYLVCLFKVQASLRIKNQHRVSVTNVSLNFQLIS